jgi:uncharacterized protein (DUF2147 family)
MRKLLVLIAAAAMPLLAAGPASAVSDDDLIGVWRHPDNGSHIQIYSCGASACAKVASVTEAGRKDVHNPDPKLRDRPVVGVVIMNGGKKVGPLKWQGRLYNTLDGGTYSGTLELMSEKQLKLSGCVLGGLICDSRVWTRVK